MLMGTSVRRVTFQFISMAFHLNVKHLFSYVLMCFLNLLLLGVFLYCSYYRSWSWKEEPVCNSVFYSDIKFLKPYTEAVGLHTSRTAACNTTPCRRLI